MEVDLGCGGPRVKGVLGCEGPGVPPPGEGRTGCTWGRIGRRRTRRSGWCGPCRAPQAATPWKSLPGCAPRRGAACAAGAARIWNRGRSFCALLLSPETLHFSLPKQEKKRLFQGRGSGAGQGAPPACRAANGGGVGPGGGRGGSPVALAQDPSPLLGGGLSPPSRRRPPVPGGQPQEGTGTYNGPRPARPWGAS